MSLIDHIPIVCKGVICAKCKDRTLGLCRQCLQMHLNKCLNYVDEQIESIENKGATSPMQAIEKDSKLQFYYGQKNLLKKLMGEFDA